VHCGPGIRTRLITLWQMVAVAAMIVCLNSPEDRIMYRGTISIMVMQFYVTYLWWSVGIYDKEHRQLNKPYTFFYLLSLLVLFSTLFLPQPYTRIAFLLSLVFNFTPPFYTAYRARHKLFNLSSSMTERLGLFTIIMLGEVVTGVINGATAVQEYSWQSWSNFILAILIVFALWWIFFALIADRKCKEGFMKGQLLIMCFIPILMSLGMLGATFSIIFPGPQATTAAHTAWIYRLFTFRISILLYGTALLSNLLVYPATYLPGKKTMQLLLVITGILIMVSTYIFTNMSLFMVFGLVFVLLLIVIVTIARMWVKYEEPTNG
jgi:low temperature requirement protein LtrA